MDFAIWILMQIKLIMFAYVRKPNSGKEILFEIVYLHSKLGY